MLYFDFCAVYRICTDLLLKKMKRGLSGIKNLIMLLPIIYIGYTWIYRQGKIFSKFCLLIWTTFIDQFDHPVGGKGMGCTVILASCENHFVRVLENITYATSK